MGHIIIRILFAGLLWIYTPNIEIYVKMSLPEQFSLRWNDFQANIAQAFLALLGDEDLSDVTLSAEGHNIRAHKLILSVGSPYFKELFKVWLIFSLNLIFIGFSPHLLFLTQIAINILFILVFSIVVNDNWRW